MHMCSTTSLRSFPSIAFETDPVLVWFMMPPPPPPPFFFFSFFSSKKTSGYFLYDSPLQVISGMLSLALCLQVVSQVPQHLRSCKMQAICDGYFAHQSICLVVSLDLGMSRTVHLHEFLIVSTEHTSVGFLFYFLLLFLFFITNKLLESVKMMVVLLSPLKMVGQQKACMTALISIVTLEVKIL